MCGGLIVAAFQDAVPIHFDERVSEEDAVSIPIPYGSGHSAAVEGSVVKEVSCEKCGHTYYYEHRAVGESRQHISLLFLNDEGARKSAEREARRTLTELLKSPMAVPCPRCGHYQREMIPVARADRLVWLGGIGCVGLVIAGLAALCALPATAQALSANAFQVPDENTGTIAMWCWAVSVLLAGISLGILGIRTYLNERFNPNAKDVAERIRIGRELSLTRDQAEALLRGEPRDTGKGQQRYPTKAGGDGADIEPMFVPAYNQGSRAPPIPVTCPAGHDFAVMASFSGCIRPCPECGAKCRVP